jgi:hypothetical protein
VYRTFRTIVCLTLLCWPAFTQVAPSPLPVGTIVPSVVCTADNKQTYALYLPPNFSTTRQWPIIYVFDPGARGQAAVEAIKPAAEKFGYIIAASNNSRNGPMGGSS